MKGHPHHKMAAMSEFNKGHWQKNEADIQYAQTKYTEGEMSNPEHLKKMVDKQNQYARSHKAQH